MPDRCVSHAHDALRQPAGVHQLAGQHEERHRHQRIVVDALQHVLREDLRIEIAQVQHQRDARSEQRKGDGHAERHRAQQRADKDKDSHDGLPALIRRWRRTAAPVRAAACGR
ncbi:hypothetical protein D3C72_1704990 [compost metagenome]